MLHIKIAVYFSNKLLTSCEEQENMTQLSQTML